MKKELLLSSLYRQSSRGSDRSQRTLKSHSQQGAEPGHLPPGRLPCPVRVTSRRLALWECRGQARLRGFSPQPLRQSAPVWENVGPQRVSTPAEPNRPLWCFHAFMLVLTLEPHGVRVLCTLGHAFTQQNTAGHSSFFFSPWPERHTGPKEACTIQSWEIGDSQKPACGSWLHHSHQRPKNPRFH